MEPLQGPSVKIKKNRRTVNPSDRNFLCGGCQCAYKSYPALYLHIKRKHNGVRPPNTKTSRVTFSLTRDKIHTGRPQKPSHDVDGVDEHQVHLENVQSDLLGFLGERLGIVSAMGSKPEFQSLITEIMNTPNDTNEESMTQLKKQTEDLYQDLTNNIEPVNMELDFDSFSALDQNDSLKILCWFLLWLGKYVVKIQVLTEMTFILSKVWKVLTQKQLQIQDLDNKLVWNGVTKECEPYLKTLSSFEGKKELIYEFVSKMCHLIGKTFE